MKSDLSDDENETLKKPWILKGKMNQTGEFTDKSDLAIIIFVSSIDGKR